MIDNARIADWLRNSIDGSIDQLTSTKLPGGHSSGVWKLDFQSDKGPQSLVLRAASDNPMVFECDAGHEGKILQAIGKAGGPVPEILAVDEEGAVLGIPSFVMQYVDGRAFPDATTASYHGEGWYRDADKSEQRQAWFSYIDLLVRLHKVDVETANIPITSRVGSHQILDYWRRSLLDIMPAEHASGSLSHLDWLEANLPENADSMPAICMGDARAGNCLMSGFEGRALIDFEVCHIGNPAGDLAYSLITDEICRSLSDGPAQHVPSAEETWDYWEKATGRSNVQRPYWMAFSFTIFCITVFRSLVMQNVPTEQVEQMNPFFGMWQNYIDGAS